jgi:hypothetical protein
MWSAQAHCLDCRLTVEHSAFTEGEAQAALLKHWNTRPASATAVEVTEEQVHAMVLADDMQTGHERCRHMLRAALAAGLGNGRR